MRWGHALCKCGSTLGEMERNYENLLGLYVWKTSCRGRQQKEGDHGEIGQNIREPFYVIWTWADFNIIADSIWWDSVRLSPSSATFESSEHCAFVMNAFCTYASVSMVAPEFQIRAMSCYWILAPTRKSSNWVSLVSARNVDQHVSKL